MKRKYANYLHTACKLVLHHTIAILAAHMALAPHTATNTVEQADADDL